MKNTKYVNKTVIRKQNTNNRFTTIHHAILHDKRLTSTAFRILSSILSDSDYFKISCNLFENRLNLSKKTVKKAFENLEQCGYVNRKKMPRGFYYTISEYGNLKAPIKETEAESNPSKEIQIKLKAVEDQLVDYLFKYNDFIEADEHILNDVLDLKTKHEDNNGLLDIQMFKTESEIYFNKLKKQLVDYYFNFKTELSEHYSKSAIKQYKEWLIDEINTKNNTLNDNICKIMWNQIKSRNYKFKTDYETAMRDKAEEDFYDNQ